MYPDKSLSILISFCPFHNAIKSCSTHLNLSSLVSSVWVCSSSCRLLTCSSLTSWISALMHCSLAYSYRKKKKEQRKQRRLSVCEREGEKDKDRERVVSESCCWRNGQLTLGNSTEGTGELCPYFADCINSEQVSVMVILLNLEWCICSTFYVQVFFSFFYPPQTIGFFLSFPCESYLWQEVSEHSFPVLRRQHDEVWTYNSMLRVFPFSQHVLLCPLSAYILACN